MGKSCGVGMLENVRIQPLCVNIGAVYILIECSHAINGVFLVRALEGSYLRVSLNQWRSGLLEMLSL